MKKILILSAAVLILVLFSGPIFGQEAEPANADTTNTQDYTNGSVAQLSFIGGKVFIQRPSDLGYEEGSLNSPISEGDRIGTSEGRAEIHFGRSNYLRLDENTKIDIMSLPKKGDDHVRFRVWSGHAYLVVGTIMAEKAIEVHTPDSSSYILEKGVYRIDVREDRETGIMVFEGLLETAGQNGSRLLKAGHRVEIGEGEFKGEPSLFMAVNEDAFDDFNTSRTSLLARTAPETGKHMPEEIDDYEGELNRYGRWVNVEPYGNVWVPGDVDESWRPYWNGHWTWIGLTGWTWVPYEPWGWVTFHYGRWHWGVGLGWYWIPTSLWGPAWVSWWNDMDYIGWSPLSWYGYPGILIDGMFYGDYRPGFYPGRSGALTVVRRDHLRDPNVSAVSLRGTSLNGLNRISMSRAGLGLRPDGARVTIQNIEGNRLILKRDASSSKLVRSDGKSAASPKTLPSGRTVIERKDKDQGGQPGTVRQGPSGKSSSGERKIRKTSSMSSPEDRGSSGRAAGTVRTYPSSSSTSRGTISSDRSGSRGSSSPRVSPRSGSRGSSSSVKSRGSSGSSGRSGSVSRKGSSGSSRSSGSSKGGSRSSGGSRSGGSVKKH